MKEVSAIYAFVIIFIKIVSRGPNFGGEKWQTLFLHLEYVKESLYTKKSFSASKSHGSPKFATDPYYILYVFI